MPPSHKLGDVTSLLSVKVRPRLNKGLNHCHCLSDNLGTDYLETAGHVYTGSPGPREHRITAARPHGDVRLEHALEEPAQQAAVVDGLLGLHVDELHVAAEALAHVARDLADGVDQADLDSRAARVDGAVEEPRAPVLVRLRVRVRVGFGLGLGLGLGFGFGFRFGFGLRVNIRAGV